MSAEFQIHYVNLSLAHRLIKSLITVGVPVVLVISAGVPGLSQILHRLFNFHGKRCKVF